MEFPKQEYWSGLPFPSPGDLPELGNQPESPALQVALSQGFHLHQMQTLNSKRGRGGTVVEKPASNAGDGRRCGFSPC